MPTIEFEICRSKPTWKKIKVTDELHKKELVYDSIITEEEWVEFIENNLNEKFSWGDSKGKKSAIWKSEKLEKTLKHEFEVTIFFTSKYTSYISVILWRKNKINTSFLLSMVEHFNAKTYKMSKEYILK
ncbi:hypothetical protein GCM10027035_10790 [Emticicia sediminis]